VQAHLEMSIMISHQRRQSLFTHVPVAVTESGITRAILSATQNADDDSRLVWSLHSTQKYMWPVLGVLAVGEGYATYRYFNRKEKTPSGTS